NGQRQAMFLENVPGLAERILRNFVLDHRDTALIVSSSGCNVVPVEMALCFRKAGVRTIGLVSLAHAEVSASRQAEGLRLHEVVDLVLNTGAPPGDAMVRVPGWSFPVAPGSTVGGCMIVNALKAEIAARLAAAGCILPVLTSAVHIGAERSAELFEAAYDEHARRLARLYAHPVASQDQGEG
ncbi:MAG: sugar isomerase domain-containing protein, partial [Gemmatales bacterium]|nr:sugar isomerase domain-containing protein [Gemmatales bacterium]MDW8386209.1 sugar isomerase domain-containing protein [Gemmatales bacterium]